MRLLFLVQKNAWFVEHAQAWYRLNDQSEIALAVSGLAMNMINQHDLIEQPHQAGTAKISQPNDKCLSVVLSTPDNITVETINVPLGAETLLNIDWHTKQFRDGWMSADATVTLDNVGKMYVDAYLPARNGSDGKAMFISNSQTGGVKEVWMARDKKTRIAIVEGGGKGKVSINLKCDPEAIDQSIDPRQLGFVLVAEEARPA